MFFICRKELSREMVDFAGRLRNRLADRLKGQFVTLAVDGGKVHKKACVCPNEFAPTWLSDPVDQDWEIRFVVVVKLALFVWRCKQ